MEPIQSPEEGDDMSDGREAVPGDALPVDKYPRSAAGAASTPRQEAPPVTTPPPVPPTPPLPESDLDRHPTPGDGVRTPSATSGDSTLPKADGTPDPAPRKRTTTPTRLPKADVKPSPTELKHQTVLAVNKMSAKVASMQRWCIATMLLSFMLLVAMVAGFMLINKKFDDSKTDLVDQQSAFVRTEVIPENERVIKKFEDELAGIKLQLEDLDKLDDLKLLETQLRSTLGTLRRMPASQLDEMQKLTKRLEAMASDFLAKQDKANADYKAVADILRALREPLSKLPGKLDRDRTLYLKTSNTVAQAAKVIAANDKAMKDLLAQLDKKIDGLKTSGGDSPELTAKLTKLQQLISSSSAVDLDLRTRLSKLADQIAAMQASAGNNAELRAQIDRLQQQLKARPGSEELKTLRQQVAALSQRPTADAHTKLQRELKQIREREATLERQLSGRPSASIVRDLREELAIVQAENERLKAGGKTPVEPKPTPPVPTGAVQVGVQKGQLYLKVRKTVKRIDRLTFVPGKAKVAILCGEAKLSLALPAQIVIGNLESKVGLQQDGVTLLELPAYYRASNRTLEIDGKKVQLVRAELYQGAQGAHWIFIVHSDGKDLSWKSVSPLKTVATIEK